MRFLLRFFATIGLIVFLLVAAGIGFFLWARTGGPRIADNTLLAVDMSQAFPDAPPDGGLTHLLFPARPSLLDVLGALDRAGNDPHVKGLVARLGDDDMGFAQVQELRDAILAFRAKGKRAVAYADSFGEFGSGTRSYYLASSFDEIWLQPYGLLGLVGLRAELPFFRGTLDLLGIVPHFDHREEYKTAMNMVTESKITPAQQEETDSLLHSIFGQISSGIAASRGIAGAPLRDLIDHGPLLTEEAVTAHLIDHIGDREDAIASLRSAIGAQSQPISLSAYLDRAGAPHQRGPTIALIYANGLIARGGGSDSPLSEGGVLGADTVVRAFRLATNDSSVRAILFRIDSPGGSAVASETIWREVKRAHDAGKPVIVSMGDVAGSGGYYIAAPADKFVAEPATLTASIGVVGGKLILDGLMKKLGINWQSVEIGSDASGLSALQDFTPQEYARFEAMLDDVYAGFKKRVADGRKLSADAVEEAAKGRVWTGEDAKPLGLVDELGGFSTALALAKQAADIAADQDVTLKLFPPPENKLGTILARLSGRAEENGTGASGSRSLALLRTMLARLDVMLLQPGALVMPPIEMR